MSPFITASNGKSKNAYKWVYCCCFQKSVVLTFYTKLVYQSSMFSWYPVMQTSPLPTTFTRLSQVNWALRKVCWAPPHLWRPVSLHGGHDSLTLVSVGTQNLHKFTLRLNWKKKSNRKLRLLSNCISRAILKCQWNAASHIIKTCPLYWLCYCVI